MSKKSKARKQARAAAPTVAGALERARLRGIIQDARVARAAGRDDAVDWALSKLPPVARRAVLVELGRPISDRVTPEQEAALRAVWAQVPDLECRGKCWDSCGAIQMTDPEHALTARAGVEIADSRYDGSATLCPALTVLNTCSVYDVRPTICRLFGAVENMPCSQGCQPAGGRAPLRIRDGYRLLAEAYRIAGDDQAADELLADFATDELADAEEARIRAHQAAYMAAVDDRKLHARANRSHTVIYAHGPGRPSSKPAPGVAQ